MAIHLSRDIYHHPTNYFRVNEGKIEAAKEPPSVETLPSLVEKIGQLMCQLNERQFEPLLSQEESYACHHPHTLLTNLTSLFKIYAQANNQPEESKLLDSLMAEIAKGILKPIFIDGIDYTAESLLWWRSKFQAYLSFTPQIIKDKINKPNSLFSQRLHLLLRILAHSENSIIGSYPSGLEMQSKFIQLLAEADYFKNFGKGVSLIAEEALNKGNHALALEILENLEPNLDWLNWCVKYDAPQILQIKKVDAFLKKIPLSEAPKLFVTFNKNEEGCLGLLKKLQTLNTPLLDYIIQKVDLQSFLSARKGKPISSELVTLMVERHSFNIMGLSEAFLHGYSSIAYLLLAKLNDQLLDSMPLQSFILLGKILQQSKELPESTKQIFISAIFRRLDKIDPLSDKVSIQPLDCLLFSSIAGDDAIPRMKARLETNLQIRGNHLLNLLENFCKYDVQRSPKILELMLSFTTQQDILNDYSGFSHRSYLKVCEQEWFEGALVWINFGINSSQAMRHFILSSRIKLTEFLLPFLNNQDLGYSLQAASNCFAKAMHDEQVKDLNHLNNLVKIIRLLVTKGADISTLSKKELLALDAYQETPLHRAARTGRLDEVKKLLEAPLEVKIKLCEAECGVIERKTPLRVAIDHWNIEIAFCLLQHTLIKRFKVNHSNGSTLIPFNPDLVAKGSNYFSKLVLAKFKEGQQDEIELQFEEPEAIQCLVNYFMTGFLDINHLNFKALAYTADVFHLDEVEAKLKIWLSKHPECENWRKYLVAKKSI